MIFNIKKICCFILYVFLFTHFAYGDDFKRSIYIKPEYGYAWGLNTIGKGAAQESTYRLTSQKADGAALYGLSLGYVLNPNISGDIFVGYLGDFKLASKGAPTSFIIKRGGTLQVVQRDANLDLKIKSSFLMLNTYYSFNLMQKLSPYVGVGLGVARNKTSDYIVAAAHRPDTFYSSKGFTSYNFAYSASIGLKYTLTQNWSADIQYKVMHLGAIKNKGYSYYLAGNKITDFGKNFKSNLNVQIASISVSYSL